MNFVDSDIRGKEIEQKFGEKIPNVRDNDPFKASRNTSINNERVKKKFFLKKRKRAKDINEKIEELDKNFKKIKKEFDPN